MNQCDGRCYKKREPYRLIAKHPDHQGRNDGSRTDHSQCMRDAGSKQEGRLRPACVGLPWKVNARNEPY